ncbi:MAG: hypothetical protein HC905_27370 [Bacteroidales bacterium]|nr:hypothetical protein [Bacteroidales bacterium]
MESFELQNPKKQPDFLARNQPIMSTDNIDNMPVLNPGNNFFIRNFPPDTSKDIPCELYVRVYHT